MVLPLVLLTALGLSLALQQANSFQEKRLKKDLELIGRAISIPVGEALDNNDLEAVKLALKSVFVLGEVYGASVFGVDGSPLARAGVTEVDLRQSKIPAQIATTGEGQEEFAQVQGKELFSHFLSLFDNQNRIQGLIHIARKASDFDNSLSYLKLLAWVIWGVFSLAIIAVVFLGHYGGTLLLDELGEMPLALQAKLLRVLQDGKIRPVGSDKEIQLDVRVLGATNRNLSQAIEKGEFREDLYYRLETFTLQVPPLRERGEDVRLLSNYFISAFNARQNTHIKGFTDAAWQLISQHNFTGNVRELHNSLERAATFCQGKLIDVEHLPKRLANQTEAKLLVADSDLAVTANLEQKINPDNLLSLAEVQSQYVQKVLAATQGNKRQAAKILGITRRTLYRWLES